MRTYFDTSVLVKIYAEEPDSSLADALMRAADVPVSFTPLHALEIRNALRLKRFRDELSEAELASVLELLQEDLQAGRLAASRLDLEAVHQRAEGLSARHTAAVGVRSLDLLHVAAALELGEPAFASFDQRQREVAQREGLQLTPPALPAGRPPPRPKRAR